MAERIADVFEIIGQKLLVLGDIISPFIDGNIRVGAIETRVNKTIKFLYSLIPALQGGCELNNCYYLSKKRFVRVKI